MKFVIAVPVTVEVLCEVEAEDEDTAYEMVDDLDFDLRETVNGVEVKDRRMELEYCEQPDYDNMTITEIK